MTALFLESQTNTNEDYLILIGVLQFIVGITQLVGATIRTIAIFFTKKSIKTLVLYWLMVIVYFLVLLLFIHQNWNELLWLPSAWLIAIWYVVKIVIVKSNNSELIINH